MVDHKILLEKLSWYGVKYLVLQYLRSYLVNRHLQVRVNGHISNEFGVASGVPQSSYLGPSILFIIFINDIGDSINSKFQWYADDVKM